MFSDDLKKLEKHGQVLAEIATLLEPDHELGLHAHFRELYTNYLRSLSMIETEPDKLEELCEPSFFRKTVKGWADMRDSNATELSMLNEKTFSTFKLSLVAYSMHFNGYLDRDVDVKSRNSLRTSDGLNYRYNCRWPYKNHIEQTC